MDAPIVRFKQRNVLTKLGLTLHPDYAEFYVSGTRGNSTGFNFRYEMLPNAFDYRTHRPKDLFVTFSLMIVAPLSLFELAIHPRDSAFSLLGFMVFFGAVMCAIGYGLRRMPKREYTVLATPAGRLLIAQDRQHDAIVTELQSRRTAALKRAAVINPLEQPWREVKKFKWLSDEGIISEDDYQGYRALILASVEPATEKALDHGALH
ncbi:MAG TPA: hypothetical protein VLX44_19950 [Xanthobacteraceae bacterium]|nr:hypothetical protein [Xanthobacteraceae bacterium]